VVDTTGARSHNIRMGRLTVRGVRGATTVQRDEPHEIRDAVQELIEAMLEQNDLTSMDIVSAIFTTTPDLVAEFPAHAARLYGWTDVPLLCAQELPVDGALPRCIRILLHVETTRLRHEMRHLYLRDAILLRQDLMSD
jgi:chorismate mutase